MWSGYARLCYTGNGTGSDTVRNRGPVSCYVWTPTSECPSGLPYSGLPYVSNTTIVYVEQDRKLGHVTTFSRLHPSLPGKSGGPCVHC